MMNSAAGRSLPTPLVALVAALIGTGAALVIGLLTFGVQATVNPDHVPLAIGTTDPSAAVSYTHLTLPTKA